MGMTRKIRDRDLHVELGTRVGRSDVETDGLTTQEVLTSSDAAGNLEGKVSAVRIDVIGCPHGTAETGLVDLEPFQASDGGGLCIGDLGHVHNFRTRVGTSVPLGGDSSASSDTAHGGSRGGTINITDLLLYISLLFQMGSLINTRLTISLEFTSTTGLLVGGRRTQAVLELKAVRRM